MLNMRIDKIIYALVEQFLARDPNRSTDRAMHFHLDLDMFYFTNKATYSERRGLHLLYHLPPQFNYISVFSAVTEKSFTPASKVEKWEHEVSHDSCWRDIRVFADTYFGMAERINDRLEADGEPRTPPISMTEHNRSALFEGMFEWLPCVVTKDPEDSSNYKRSIRLI